MNARAALLGLGLALALCAVPATSARGATLPVLEPVLTVAPDVPQAALDAQLAGRVVLSVLVSRVGLVDSVTVTSGDARLRTAAIDAARWTVFEPQSAPVWTTLTVSIDGRLEPEPLSPDVLGMAREAEAANDGANALVAWTGALRRLGTHPSLTNEWTIRERALRIARSYPALAGVPGETAGMARGARTEQERVVVGSRHAALVAKWDHALTVAPWWPDPYLWRAGSLAACGRSAEARRSLRFYQLGATDSTGRWLASTALQMLAGGDSLGASELIKKRAQTFNADVPGARR